uniref:Uncharacterized protein n=1 Tax=Tanacetum cinerariifolium TaxID=118510 RepID=A0A6L2KAU6_TANCI|nr:hypothetical protein [Tanacetum cinerariifolium]
MLETASGLILKAARLQLHTWLAFGRNTLELDLFREETDECTTLHQSRRRKGHTDPEMASQLLVTASEHQRDGVRKFETTLGHNRHSEELMFDALIVTGLFVSRKKITMAGPITKEYISTTSKSFVLNDINGKMIKKNFIEIEGTFLLKVRDNTFYRNDAEDVFKHINSFLEVVEPLKIRELSHDRFRLSVFPILLSGRRYSRGDKFCKWLKSCFEKFHELEYEVLLKLEECWWKVNSYEIAPFTRTENFRRGPYANIKTKWADNTYITVNHIFRRDYEASNIGCTQENHEHKVNLIPKPLNYRVKRFEMLKYSFTDDEEYITIKESEYLNYSKDSLDAYQELLRLINEGCVVTTPED